ncbi:MmgE/PrpD family protein [Rhizobium sp. SSA_523]|uniref:MmgE/PrpD family protein n=2 Tax=Rhizobium sp. SSA_523 TaxID=2952477 RepID=UPI0025816A6C|nr:MmgE/PrpD family protein [Rhizobium sp. SSA_523]MCO5731601.1 MmgE/PrpD family protein [Rhizobium sp. SSA_523]
MTDMNVSAGLPSLSAVLAKHAVSAFPHGMPAEVSTSARSSLIDAIAVSAAASTLGAGCRAFRDIAVETGSGTAAMIGYGGRCSAPMAAWVNGALAHAIDYEDTHDHAIAHPNAAALAAALAMADTVPRPISGRELLGAIAVAADLVCRIAASFTIAPDRNGWHTTPWLGVFGAATAAGRLLQLDDRQMLDAWSLAMSQMCSFGELKFSPDSDVRSVRDAFAAKAGVLGALLAAKGVRGYDDPLGGQAGFLAAVARGAYSTETLLDGLGDHFLGTEVSFKPWPSCRGTHAYIEAGIEIACQPGFAAEAIEAIEITINEKNVMLCEPREMKVAPRTPIAAKFSIPFTLASALLNGRVTLESFTDAAIHQPGALAIATKVRHRLDPDIPLRDTTRGSVIVLANNRRFEQHIVTGLGHPSRPLSEAQVKAKFDDCIRYAHQESYRARAAELWDTLMTVEESDDIRKLTSLLV